MGGEKMGGQERDNVTFTRGEVLTGESLKPGEIYNILRHYQGKNRAELIERQYKDVAFTTYTDKSSEGYDFHIEVTVGRFPSAAAANEVLEIFQSEEDSDNRLWTKGNLLFRAKNSRDFKF